MTNLYVKIGVGSPNAFQVAVTLYQNGAPTALSCQTGTTAAVTGATSSCSNTTSSVSVLPGDSLAYLVSANIGNGTDQISIAMHCQ
jgi:diaminopimelate epimerase